VAFPKRANSGTTNSPFIAFHLAQITLNRNLKYALVSALGAFTPALFQNPASVFEMLPWWILIFPLYRFLIPVADGWWGFLELPLLLVFG